MLGNTALAIPASPSERAQVFASCAGRLSALEEHQRFFDGAASENTALLVRQFVDLLEATLPDAIAYGMPGRQPLIWRVEAKMHQLTLLHRATYHTDDFIRVRNGAAAELNLASCNNMLLGS